MSARKYVAVIEGADGALRTERITRSGERPKGLLDGERVAFKCNERDLELNMRLYILWASSGRIGEFKRRILPSASEEIRARAGVSLPPEQMRLWRPKEARRAEEALGRGKGKPCNRRTRLKREARMNELSQRRAAIETAAGRKRMAMEEERIMSSVCDVESKRVLRPRRVRESV